MRSDIFPERLKSARLIKGFSLRKLSAQTGGKVSANSLSRYEKGVMVPGEDIFYALCDALDIPPSFFERPPVHLQEVEFRKLTKLPLKKQQQIREEAADYLGRYAELEQLLGVEQRFENPFGSKPRIRGREDMEEYCDQLRQRWNLGTNPISDVMSMLESHDLKIQKINIEESFDGMAAAAEWNGELHRIIVINTNDRQSVRWRFTALHELAHIIFDLSEITDEQTCERLCHHAAGAILLPGEELKERLGEKRTSIHVNELIAIKEDFGISLGAIIFRAKFLNIISDSYANQQFRYFNMRGWRGPREPGEFCLPRRSSQSDRFSQLIYRGIEEEMISLSKAAHLSGMRTDEFLSTYNNPA